MKTLQVIESLERADARTREQRANRLVWLSQYEERPSFYADRLETLALFESARSSFVNENFIATLVIAVSYIEQVLVDELESNGKSAGKTFAESIKNARSASIFSPQTIDDIDTLRLLRNPYAHKKPDKHEYNLSNRVDSVIPPFLTAAKSRGSVNG